VEVYRTDVKGKLPTGKSDKKGNFTFAGFPLGQTFALAISAANIQPIVYPNIRGGMDDITITVVLGDGRQLSEDEARQVSSAPAAAAASSNTSTGAAATPGKPAKESAEDKKKREELEKQTADITARNEKVKNSDEIIKRSLEAGNAAFKAQNYDVAIAKYDEGFNASPTFVGSAPVLLNNKGTVLSARARELYNANVKLTDATQKIANRTKITKDFTDALDAYSRSLTVIKNAGSTTEVPAAKVAELKLQTLNGAQNAMLLMVRTEMVDGSKTELARALTHEYVATETDAAKKLKAQTTLGDVFRVAGDFNSAVAEYKKALEIKPDDADALGGLGLCLFSVGASASPENTPQMQEGLNYMQRFTEIAPDTHPLKTSIKDAVDYLKTKQLTPQKTGKPSAKKKT
ncbi:MAG: tetratricopeptide repeat protein, partial [Acidobacteria bacterium]|nr:tetratricopeptide repeat protein [Acidobacteriota bacterium]